LYDKLKHLKNCIFYTDKWDAFAKVLPKKRHIIGHGLERNNSNTRHNLGRFTRKTKVVSKSETMVELTFRLWWALNKSSFFTFFRQTALSIFK